MMVMTFVAAIVIALMIFTANEAFKASAMARGHTKEQLAALSLFKDIGVLIRRAYDVAEAHHLNKAAAPNCPANYVQVALKRDPIASPATYVNGFAYLCFPKDTESDGSDSGSCVLHPLDSKQMENVVDKYSLKSHPRICFTGFPTNNRQMIHLAFGLDPRQGKDYWTAQYKKWGVEEDSFNRQVARIGRHLDLLPQARAQNDTNAPWFPPVADLNTAAMGFKVSAEPVVAPSTRSFSNRECSDKNTLCVTYSVCLRINGCGLASDVNNESFVQTVGLDH